VNTENRHKFSTKEHFKGLLFIIILFFYSGCLSFSTSKSLTDTKKYLESLGKKFTLHELLELKRLNLSDSAVTDNGLRYISNLKKLQILLLKRTDINGDGLAHLGKNRNLVSLDLESSQLSDDGMKGFLKSAKFSYLNLSKTGISDYGIKNLLHLVQLNELNLSGTLITDESISLLSKFKLKKLDISKTDIRGRTFFLLEKNKNLAHLNLSYLRLQESAVPHIRQLKFLESLKMRGSSISDSDIASIVFPETLKYLDLSDNPFTNRGLAALKKKSGIRHLDISDTKITGKGFAHFIKYKSLKKLNISGISATYKSLMYLKLSLPETDITAHYMISSGRDSAGVLKFPFRSKPVKMRIGQGDVWLKEPLVPGISVPVKVVFFDVRRRIKKDFKLKSDLIFKLNGVSLTVFSGSSYKSGKGKVIFKYGNAECRDGVFSGKISVNRIVTGSVLEVWLKGKNNSPDTFIGETQVDFMFRDVAGVFLTALESPVKAGKTHVLKIYPYDYRGRAVRKWPARGLRFFVDSEYPVYIDRKAQKGTFWLKPSVYQNGVAAISVRADKTGSYSIIYRNGRRYNRYNSESVNGKWNRITFTVGASEYINSIAQIPEISEAGEQLRIKLWLFDRYNNIRGKKHFKFSIRNGLNGKMFKNSMPLKEGRIYEYNSEKDYLSIFNSGKYIVTVMGPGKQVSKKLTVKPSKIHFRINRKMIILDRNHNKIILPYNLSDKFGNAPDSPVSFVLRSQFSRKGNAEFSGKGLKVVRSYNIGKNIKGLDVKVTAEKGISNGSITVLTQKIDSLKIFIDDRILEFMMSSPGIKGGRTKVLYDSKTAKYKFSENEINSFILSKSLKKNPGKDTVYYSWKQKIGKRQIQHEFTYYRKWNRLDYQKWDLLSKKRLKRILWKNLKEVDILSAADRNLPGLPGKKEIFN